ncbi:MAG: 16S rRNA (cytosine(1402)-N(4))-methyltransferase RsmH [Bacteroidales bacterium]|nr:16S rRNA (cytosine(1402)-N(4))-methyltransferase RsmH [Bacteroidales bacterium]MDT8432502.1 16S rRNA (cytosine(1402)-N(4))-methyltransferase RsmH [Bacteroidales bacterium]
MNQNNMAYHRPVLLKESVEGLNIQPKGTYVDLTFGGGGHSRHVLEKLGKKGTLIAFDQDPDAAKNVIDDRRFIFVRANFRYLRNFLRYHGIEAVNGILADLGISSHQIDQPGRGFSFRADSRLDMRMDPSSRKSAVEVLNETPENELYRIFRTYGELKNTGAVVRAVMKGREAGLISSTAQLEALLGELVPRQTRSKFLAKVFQAIRIEVNGEMEALEEMLEQTAGVMAEGGRLVVITYHSLEDRLVKNYMKTGNTVGELKKDFYGHPETCWKQINRKVITPGEDELRENSRARSAKLRIAEKK